MSAPLVAQLFSAPLPTPRLLALPSLPLSSSPPAARRAKRTSYVYLACDFCRSRKKRCDRPPSATSPSSASSLSSCTQCAAAHVPCVQSSTQRAKRQRRTKSTSSSSHNPALTTSASSPSLALAPAPTAPLIARHDRVERAIAVSVLPAGVVSLGPHPQRYRTADDSAGIKSPHSASAALQSATSPHAFASPSITITSTTSNGSIFSSSSSAASSSSALPLNGPYREAPHASLAVGHPRLSAPSTLPATPPSANDARLRSASTDSNSSMTVNTGTLYDNLPPHPSSSAASYNLPQHHHHHQHSHHNSTHHHHHQLGNNDWPMLTDLSPLPSSAPASPLSDFFLHHPPPAQRPAPPARHPGAGFTSSPASPGTSPRSTPSFRLVALSATYVSSYFSWINRGLYTHLDEQSFYQAYSQVHVNRAAQADEAWLLCVGAVMAIGARMHQNTEYSEECAEVARLAAREIRQSNALSDDRLALAYRSLLVLRYYCAAMREDTEEWMSLARGLLSIDSVLVLVPASVVCLSQVEPSYTEGFSRVSADRLQGAPDPAAGDGRMRGSLSPEVLYQQSVVYPLDRWKYLKIKRLLQSQLSLDADDPELLEGLEWDASLDVTSFLSVTNHEEELAAANLRLVQSLKTIHLNTPLPFSIYDALSYLLMAEASVLTGPVRAGVFGKKATVYELLGQRRQMVRAAREAVRSVVEMCVTLPTCLPPFCINYMRSVALLGEWDDQEHSGELLVKGMAVLKEVGAQWPGTMQAALDLQRHLELWSSEQLAAAQTALDDCKGRVEAQLGDGHPVMDLVPVAAADFVERTAALQRARSKKHSIDGLRHQVAGAQHEARKRAHHEHAGEKLDSQWVIDSLSALFARAMGLGSMLPGKREDGEPAGWTGERRNHVSPAHVHQRVALHRPEPQAAAEW